jgi:hypothetical protein
MSELLAQPLAHEEQVSIAAQPTKDQLRMREYYRNNQARVRARQHVYSLAHRAEINARQRKYNKENAEEVRKRMRDWARAHRELVRQRCKEYYWKHRREILDKKKISKGTPGFDTCKLAECQGSVLKPMKDGRSRICEICHTVYRNGQAVGLLRYVRAEYENDISWKRRAPKPGSRRWKAEHASAPSETLIEPDDSC